jgi:hypothetical protein
VAQETSAAATNAVHQLRVIQDAHEAWA